MLRAFAWLVSNVASTLRTIFNRRSRDWHTDTAEEGLPSTPNDIAQETFNAENTGAPKALILGSARSARPSKDERALLKSGHLFPLFPTNVGIQGRPRT